MKNNRRVGIGHIVFVFLTTLVLFGCGKTGVNQEISPEESMQTDEAISDNQAVQNASGSTTTVVVAEEMDESTPDSILLDDFVDTLSSNYNHINSMSESFAPTGMAVEVTTGVFKDVLFANGTSINILSTKTDVSGFVQDTVVQYALGNNLDDDNRGFGAVVTWQDGSKTKYVYVSNMVEIYGGSYKADLHSNVNITVDGETYRNAYPNLSFLYGGCLEGDLVGNINISINQARPMFLIGGGHNGSVFGNVDIVYDRNSWSLDIIGGGYADSIDKDEIALCYGDINISMSTAESSSDSNCLIGGGIALTHGDYTAISDVIGNISINIDGQSFKEVCGGGLAVRLDEKAEMPVSNVFGDTNLEINNCKIVSDGILCESGLGDDGLAMVFGDCTVNDTRLYVDRRAQGIVDHYPKLKQDKYYESPITKAFEAVNKADRYIYYDPQRTENILDKASKLGFEGKKITYAVVVYYVDGKYHFALYNYGNDTFTTKEASDAMNIYQNVKDVQGINRRYKEEYVNEILEGDIEDYLESTKDIEMYTSESYDPDNEKEYTIIYPDMNTYLQWNGTN